MKVLVTLFFLILFFSSFSQDGAVHKGIYMIYENISYNTKLNHKISTSGFDEFFYSDINTYPNIKLGYTITAWGNLGLSDWAVWGVDFGFGLNYGKSVMNALSDGNYNYLNMDNFHYSPELNFESIQPTGNQCTINDYGINLHLDAGTLVYIGAEFDAGVSHISFTDSKIQEQTVNSTGWYANARLQYGISIPLPFSLHSNFKMNFKMYGVFLGWSVRTYDLDWVSSDKTLNDFSRLQSNGSPIGIGYSLSLLFD
jgi:hypothetical protein